MEKNKLISMTDFVLEQSEIVENSGDFLIFKRSFIKIENYANFLKQPLTLGMFVTCDDNGNVLEEQMIFASDDKDYIFESKQFDKYQQAKERCLFFSQHGNEEMFDQCLAKVFLDEFFNIEQLANEIRNIKLTPTAQKQIGL